MNSPMERLAARQTELRQRLASLRADLSRQREPLSADFADQATQRENDDVLEAIGRATETELATLDLAIRRLQSGSYGICARCGQPIAAKRLEAVPYTDRCSDCAA